MRVAAYDDRAALEAALSGVDRLLLVSGNEVGRRRAAVRGVSLEDYRAGLLAAGLDEGTADFVTALEAGAAAGELHGSRATSSA